MKKRVFITGILIILLTLFSTLLTASAVLAASQTWYLWNDQSLQKDDPNGGDYITIGNTPVIFISDQAAQGDVTFSNGNWTGDIGTKGGNPGHQQIEIAVGYSPDGIAFTSFGSTMVTDSNGNFVITDAGGTVPNGYYLAVSVRDIDSETSDLQTGSGGSHIATPGSAPDFPLPELASSILLAGSIGGLGAYIWWRQRGKRLPTV